MQFLPLDEGLWTCALYEKATKAKNQSDKVHPLQGRESPEAEAGAGEDLRAAWQEPTFSRCSPSRSCTLEQSRPSVINV